MGAAVEPVREETAEGGVRAHDPARGIDHGDAERSRLEAPRGAACLGRIGGSGQLGAAIEHDERQVLARVATAHCDDGQALRLAVLAQKSEIEGLCLPLRLPQQRANRAHAVRRHEIVDNELRDAT